MNKKLLSFAVGLGVLIGSAQAAGTGMDLAAETTKKAANFITELSQEHPYIMVGAALTVTPLVLTWAERAFVWGKDRIVETAKVVNDATKVMFANRRDKAAYAVLGIGAGMLLQKHTNFLSS